MAGLVSVAEGVWVATHPFGATTSTVVLGDGDGCLVVDPAVTAVEIDDLASEIAAMGRRVVAGFSTHPHWDHLLWRDSLGGAPRYTTDLGARTAVAQAEANAADARDSLDGVDVGAMARVTALDEPTIPWVGPPVEVLEHRAHAPGHAALLIAGSGVLVAGDMLSDLEIPLPDMGSADPVGDYFAALDMFAGLMERVDVVVPGHGSVGDRTELERRLEMDGRYLAGVTSGRSVEDPRLATSDDWLIRQHNVLLDWVAGTSPHDRGDSKWA